MPVDALGRNFGSLRLSLTAQCNFACYYCVPTAKRLLPARLEMSAAEFARALQLLVQLGIRRLRITGGEPLLSQQLEPFLALTRDVPLQDRALTSNGVFLADKVPMLVEHGIQRLNLSLDSLEPDCFRKLSRGGCLNDVLQGLQVALDAGLTVRINTVPVRGYNDGEIISLLAFCAERSIEIRFIELMQMGHLHGAENWRQLVVDRAELLTIIGSAHEITAVASGKHATAQRWRVEQTGAHFGIIANASAPFCAGCDRLRLTSNGMLYGCISSAESFAMRDLLPLPDAQALGLLRERLGLALDTKSPTRFGGQVTVMKFLGG